MADRKNLAPPASSCVVIGARRVNAQADGFVLFREPIADWTGLAERLGVPTPGRGAFAVASWEGDGRASFARLRRAAEHLPDVVCIAASDGAGLEPSGAAGRALIVERVLPALVRHFDSMGPYDEDRSPWLLTHVLAALIQRRMSVRVLEAVLAAVEASLGRGDATSTDQNLTCVTNFLDDVRANHPDAALGALRARPVLEALRRLSDARLWPGEGLSAALSAGLEHATPRHARAAVQISTRAAKNHGRTPEALRAVLAAAALVPGVIDVLARPAPPLDLDLRGVIRSWLAELARRGIPAAELASVTEAMRALEGPPV